jgi:hypothetical protein
MLRIWLAIACASCVDIPSPTLRGPSPSWATQDRAYRIQMYRQYRLGLAPVGIGTLLEREDGKHNYIDLRDVLGAYPKSRALYARAARRDELLSTLAVWGIAFAATAGLDQLTNGSLTPTGRDVFYITGGALVAAALAGVLVWDDPTDDIPRVYNEELREDLHIDPEESRSRASRK